MSIKNTLDKPGEQPCMFPEEDDSDKFLIFFTVDRVRPLAGDFDS